jgi:hypothetical protein
MLPDYVQAQKGVIHVRGTRSKNLGNALYVQLDG